MINTQQFETAKESLDTVARQSTGIFERKARQNKTQINTAVRDALAALDDCEVPAVGEGEQAPASATDCLLLLIRSLADSQTFSFDAWQQIFTFIAEHDERLNLQQLLFESNETGINFGVLVAGLYDADADEHDQLLEYYLALVQELQFKSEADRALVLSAFNEYPIFYRDPEGNESRSGLCLWDHFSAVYEQNRSDRSGVFLSEALYFQLRVYHGKELFTPHVEGIAYRSRRRSRIGVEVDVKAVRKHQPRGKNTLREAASQIPELQEWDRVPALIAALDEVTMVTTERGRMQGHTVQAVFDVVVQVIANNIVGWPDIKKILSHIELAKGGNPQARALFNKARIVLFKKLAVLSNDHGTQQEFLSWLCARKTEADTPEEVLDNNDIYMALIEALIPYQATTPFRERVFLQRIVNFRIADFNDALAMHEGNLTADEKRRADEISGEGCESQEEDDHEHQEVAEYVIRTEQEFLFELKNIQDLVPSAYRMVLLEECLDDLLNKSNLEIDRVVALLSAQVEEPGSYFGFANFLRKVYHSGMEFDRAIPGPEKLILAVARKVSAEQFYRIIQFSGCSNLFSSIGAAVVGISSPEKLPALLRDLSLVSSQYRRYVLDILSDGLVCNISHAYASNTDLAKQQYQLFTLLQSQLCAIDSEAAEVEDADEAAEFKREQYKKVSRCIRDFISKRFSYLDKLSIESWAEVLGFIQMLPKDLQRQMLTGTFRVETTANIERRVHRESIASYLQGYMRRSVFWPRVLTSYVKTVAALVEEESEQEARVALADELLGDRHKIARYCALHSQDTSTQFNRELLGLLSSLGESRYVGGAYSEVACVDREFDVDTPYTNCSEYYEQFHALSMSDIKNRLQEALNKGRFNKNKVRALLFHYVAGYEKTRYYLFSEVSEQLAQRLAKFISAKSKTVALFYEAVVSVLTALSDSDYQSRREHEGRYAGMSDSDYPRVCETEYNGMLQVLVNQHFVSSNKNLLPLLKNMSILLGRGWIKGEVLSGLVQRLQSKGLMKVLLKHPGATKTLFESMLQQLPVENTAQRQVVIAACSELLPTYAENRNAFATVVKDVMLTMTEEESAQFIQKTIKIGKANVSVLDALAPADRVSDADRGFLSDLYSQFHQGYVAPDYTSAANAAVLAAAYHLGEERPRDCSSMQACFHLIALQGGEVRVDQLLAVANGGSCLSMKPAAPTTRKLPADEVAQIRRGAGGCGADGYDYLPDAEDTVGPPVGGAATASDAGDAASVEDAAYGGDDYADFDLGEGGVVVAMAPFTRAGGVLKQVAHQRRMHKLDQQLDAAHVAADGQEMCQRL